MDNVLGMFYHWLWLSWDNLPLAVAVVGMFYHWLWLFLGCFTIGYGFFCDDLRFDMPFFVIFLYCVCLVLGLFSIRFQRSWDVLPLAMANIVHA